MSSMMRLRFQSANTAAAADAAAMQRMRRRQVQEGYPWRSNLVNGVLAAHRVLFLSMPSVHLMTRVGMLAKCTAGCTRLHGMVLRLVAAVCRLFYITAICRLHNCTVISPLLSKASHYAIPYQH
jgi:hypothetical protein